MGNARSDPTPHWRVGGAYPRTYREARLGAVAEADAGAGEILGATIYPEIGDVGRFPGAERLASYARLVPAVHASGGKCWLGPTTPRANHYLRWAFVEAADAILMHRHTYTGQHVIEPGVNCSFA